MHVKWGGGRAILAILVLTASTLTGCGDDEADRAAEAAGLYQTITTFSAGFASGDSDVVVGLLSDQCGRITGSMRAAVDAVSARYDELVPIQFDADVDQNEASVSYTFENAPDLARTDERWVLENGHWRYADC